MAEDFTVKAITIIASIPRGRVSTYGTIAFYAGNPHGARQVARLLHSSSKKHSLPWHRVVNREGRISLPAGGGYERQRQKLLEEGVCFDGSDRINLDFFLWLPDD